MDQTSLGKVFNDLKHLPLQERVVAYYSFLKSADRLPQLERVSAKSVEKAEAFKVLGNQCFIRSEFESALKYYTRSVATAPPGSAELAIAYGNRSAVLLRVKKRKACLVDVNRALNGDCPRTTALFMKLMARKKDTSQWVLESDRESLTLMRKFAKLGDESAMKEIKYVEKECNFDVNSQDMNYEHKFFLPEVHFKHNPIPNASEKVKIEYSSEFGRHIVALQDLKPGELIAIEKPFSSILSWEKAFDHCSNCFVKSDVLRPCPNCSEVLFCSKRCLEDATNKYHRIECQILLLSGYPVTTNLEWRVIRLLMMATKQGEELERMMAHPVYKNPLQITTDVVPDRFNSLDYANVHNMQDHRDKRSDFDLWMAAHMTANLIHILKHTTFFEEKKRGKRFNVEQKERYMCELLLKFVFLKSQTHDICEFHEYAVKLSGSKRMLPFGSGFYSFHYLFNHSCNANVMKTFHKDTIVTYAKAPIKAGEQLFVDYGKSFETDTREERQKFLLHNYFFACKCKACEQNWPLYTSLESPDSEINMVKKLKRHAKKMLDYFGIGAIRQQHCSEPFNLLSDHLTLLHEHTTLPNWNYYVYQQDLYRMFYARGNYYPLEDDDHLTGSL